MTCLQEPSAFLSSGRCVPSVHSQAPEVSGDPDVGMGVVLTLYTNLQHEDEPHTAAPASKGAAQQVEQPVTSGISLLDQRATHALQQVSIGTNRYNISTDLSTTGLQRVEGALTVQPRVAITAPVLDARLLSSSLHHEAQASRRVLRQLQVHLQTISDRYSSNAGQPRCLPCWVVRPSTDRFWREHAIKDCRSTLVFHPKCFKCAGMYRYQHVHKPLHIMTWRTRRTAHQGGQSEQDASMQIRSAYASRDGHC